MAFCKVIEPTNNCKIMIYFYRTRISVFEI